MCDFKEKKKSHNTEKLFKLKTISCCVRLFLFVLKVCFRVPNPIGLVSGLSKTFGFRLSSGRLVLTHHGIAAIFGSIHKYLSKDVSAEWSLCAIKVASGIPVFVEDLDSYQTE